MRYEAEDFPHRLMWKIVEEQVRIADGREEGWSNPALVAMVFAFHTLEAYLNVVGERVAPEIWQDERNFFRKEPYRGWDGRLRKVMELVGLPQLPQDRPLKTILELKELRDLIAHGKAERLSGDAEGADPSYPIFTLRSLFTPKDKMTRAVHDVEQLIGQIHMRAGAKVSDPLFSDEEALQGPLSFRSHG